MHYTGSSWESISLPGGVWSSVYFVPNTTKGWIVGDGGLIVHSSNSTFSSQTNPDTSGATLNDVFSLDGQLAWAVGPGSRMLHTTDGGTNWVLNDEGLSTGNLNAVFFTSPTNGYAVGNRTLLKYTSIDDITTTTTTDGDITTTTTKKGCPCLIKEIYSENAEEVAFLREFRDEVLSKTASGRELIRLYYQVSPVMVQLLEEDTLLKENLIRLYYEWGPTIIKAMEEDEEFRGEMKALVELITVAID